MPISCMAPAMTRITLTNSHARHALQTLRERIIKMVCDDKRKVIAYLWYLNAILSIAYVVVAIAAAANQKDLETATTNHAAGFAAIWSMLILFLIVIGGTITMKRVRRPVLSSTTRPRTNSPPVDASLSDMLHLSTFPTQLKTPIATGVFLGACIMYSQMQLLLFAIFVGLAQTSSGDVERRSNNAMAVFAFFLFILYTVFSVCLYFFRHYVIDGRHREARRVVPPWRQAWVSDA